MSPASSGGIEVERYIGACLITSQSRPKGPKHYNRQPDRWAGGVPLISFTNQRWRREHNIREDPKSHLVVHTQGAPLILSNRYAAPSRTNKTKNQIPKQTEKSDNASVTSDENNVANENCLPRIIKPRKRRKKDRKPPHLLHRPPDSTASTDSADSPDIDSHPNSPQYVSYQQPSPKPQWNYFFPPKKVYYPNHQHHKLQQLPQLEPNRVSSECEISDSPKLHHAFEDVEEVKDVNGNASSCQCKYCDPSGQIWDIDRSCYSPFLTSPFAKTDDTLIKAISSFSLEDDTEESSASTSPRSSRDYSSSPDNYLFKKHVDVNRSNISRDFAAYRDGSSSGDSSAGYSIESPYGSPTNAFLDLQRSSPSMKDASRRDYEMFKEVDRDVRVSTEIVTSLNGHRDLEIKLFSWASPMADFGSDFSFFSSSSAGVGDSVLGSKDLQSEE